MKETGSPFILEETGDFAVVFKPPRMHSAPLKDGGGGTLLDWYAAIFPPVLDLPGGEHGEGVHVRKKFSGGGLVHRLDFETRGLVLFAKNREALAFFLARQDEGAFVKEYSALCQTPACAANNPSRLLPGFPPPPEAPGFAAPDFSPSLSLPFTIKSFFRPFGPGRKQVRPVTGENPHYRELAKDSGGYYRTEISGVSGTRLDSCVNFTVRIKRGFRHQIRCHLSWIGYPIVNDPLYGQEESSGSGGFLALCARGLYFPDPCGGKARHFTITNNFSAIREM